MGKRVNVILCGERPIFTSRSTSLTESREGLLRKSIPMISKRIESNWIIREVSMVRAKLCEWSIGKLFFPLLCFQRMRFEPLEKHELNESA